MSKILFVCTTDSMIWNFLIPHINYLKSQGHIVECACSKTGFYYDELIEKYGLILNYVPFKRNPYSVANIKSLFRLMGIIKKDNIDVVFCHEPVGGALGRIAGYICGCKIIYMAHGFHFFKDNYYLKNLIYSFIEQRLAKITDRIIVINDEDYKSASGFCLKKGGGVFKVDGIGCDIQKIQNMQLDVWRKRAELGIARDAFVIITVAELIPRKNIEVGIKAFCKANLSNSVYIICGEGGEQDKLKKIANNRGDIRFLGFRKDIKELNRIANVCLFPSKQEGLSIAVIEAMAEGLPMVVSDARGVKDCVIDGKSGVICEKNNVNEFSDALKFIYGKNKEAINSYYVFNRAHSKKYDINHIFSEMGVVYKDIL